MAWKGKEGRPRKESYPPCKVTGCDKTTRGSAKGFCSTHYMAFHRGRIDQDGNELRPMKRVRSYGPGARCLVEGCGRRPVGRDLCSLHYQQWENDRNTFDKIPVPDDRGYERSAYSYDRERCLVPDCDERPVNRWMCSKHAQQREAGIIDEEGNELREFLPRGRRPKGWRQEKAGYILVEAPKGHPHARHDGTIYEHRLVMEKKLGRYLEPEEIVHHKNGVRSDNADNNLELRTNRKDHPHGHEMDSKTAAQVLLQEAVEDGVGGAVRRWLEKKLN